MTLNFYCDIIDDYLYINDYTINEKNKIVICDCLICGNKHKLKIDSKKHYEKNEIHNILYKKLLNKAMLKKTRLNMILKGIKNYYKNINYPF
jgi:hypothetical protein